MSSDRKSQQNASDKPGENGSDRDANKPTDTKTGNRNVGAALRTVYQKTIDEDIPAEMLDLLGKLD